MERTIRIFSNVLMYNKSSITKKLRFLILLLLIPAFSTLSAQTTMGDTSPSLPDFHMGDLLFISDTTGMGSAIEQSTGHYTHVAIVVRENNCCMVYEALPKKGVIKTEYRQWKKALYQDFSITTTHLSKYITCRRSTLPFDTLRLMDKLNEYLGLPYDEYFLPNNGRMYCSELVYNCFYNEQGTTIFRAKPMNFKSSDGSFPLYWQQHFQQLGVEIPQGVLGTNPNDQYNSPFLQNIELP